MSAHRGPLRRRRRRRDDRARPARDAQRALRRAARRPARRASTARPRRRRRALRRAHLHARDDVLLRRQPGRASRPTCRSSTSTAGTRALPGAVHAASASSASRRSCAANGHVPRGRARPRARLRPDRRQGGRDVRHARDQRRRLPVHDHGAHLPQRRAQEDERAAAARRADRRARRPSGSGSSTASSPADEFDAAVADWAGEAGGEVAGADAARQGRDVPPAGHGASPTRSTSCARSSTLAFSTEDIQEGVQRVLREARAGVDGR